MNEWRDVGVSFYGGRKMVHIPCGTEVTTPADDDRVLQDGGPICPKCDRVTAWVNKKV